MQGISTPYIIAEIGCNHNGDMNLAKRMIDAAAECGCDAVKFQLWQKDELATRGYLEELDSGKVKIENIDSWETSELGLDNIFKQVEKFTLTYQQHQQLFQYCRDKRMAFSSTPISSEGADFLVDEGVAFLKISSMDVNNLSLIDYCLGKDVPLVISTGLASIGEIEAVYDLIPPVKRPDVTLLHCISLYPPEDTMINLAFMQSMARLFDVPVGYSDHSLGFSIPLAAIALGATMIEKHFTLDKEMPGWDHKVSANPEEMGIICRESKRIRVAIGDGRKTLTPQELDKRNKFRRSWVSAQSLTAGTALSIADLTLKRPGTGFEPGELPALLGRKIRRDIAADELLKPEDLE